MEKKYTKRDMWTAGICGAMAINCLYAVILLIMDWSDLI